MLDTYINNYTVGKEIAFIINSVNGAYNDTIEMTESYYNEHYKNKVIGLSYWTRIVVYKDINPTN